MPMKPVAAGASMFDGALANEDSVALLRAASREMTLLPEVTPILLREPMAPHIAAAREGRRITLDPVLGAFASLASSSDFLVVEGVGGFAVPLGDGLDTVDLARALALPVVMVVGDTARVPQSCVAHGACGGSGRGFPWRVGSPTRSTWTCRFAMRTSRRFANDSPRRCWDNFPSRSRRTHYPSRRDSTSRHSSSRSDQSNAAERSATPCAPWRRASMRSPRVRPPIAYTGIARLRISTANRSQPSGAASGCEAVRFTGPATA